MGKSGVRYSRCQKLHRLLFKNRPCHAWRGQHYTHNAVIFACGAGARPDEEKEEGGIHVEDNTSRIIRVVNSLEIHRRGELTRHSPPARDAESGQAGSGRNASLRFLQRAESWRERMDACQDGRRKGMGEGKEEASTL